MVSTFLGGHPICRSQPGIRSEANVFVTRRKEEYIMFDALAVTLVGVVFLFQAFITPKDLRRASCRTFLAFIALLLVGVGFLGFGLVIALKQTSP